MSVMAYNFSIALMKSSNTVVDPNHLLSSTDSGPSALSVAAVVSPVASVSASFGGSIGGSIGGSASIGGSLSIGGSVSIGGSISAGASVGTAAGTGVAGGFQECTGLDTSLEVEDYKEGGLNDRIRKFPTRVTWSNIVLKRGIGLSDDLWTWHAAYMTGTGVRRDGIITLEDDQHTALKQWHFTRGLPIRWTGPAFNAKTSEVAIEALEIIHEGITLTSPSSLASASIGSVSISVGVSL
jgi:phage tail-like protein